MADQAVLFFCDPPQRALQAPHNVVKPVILVLMESLNAMAAVGIPMSETHHCAGDEWAHSRTVMVNWRRQMAFALNAAIVKNGCAEKSPVKKGDILSAVRMALTGTAAGADVLDTMALLGPRCAARRLALASQQSV